MTDSQTTATYKDHPVTSSDIDYLANAPRLIVAMDFDGTLAPFAGKPLEARAYPGTLDDMQALADMPNTEVCLLSGRDLKQLTVISELPIPTENKPGTILLVGSHGAEPGHGPALTLSPEQSALRDKLADMAEKSATTDDGLWVEYKPTSVGLHIRTAKDHAQAEKTLESLKHEAEQIPDVHITHGKDILELNVDKRSKGTYLAGAKEAFKADAVVFAGDDTTDETAFNILDQGTDYAARPDMGIKVGEGKTAATRGVEAIPNIATFLSDLRAARAKAQS